MQSDAKNTPPTAFAGIFITNTVTLGRQNDGRGSEPVVIKKFADCGLDQKLHGRLRGERGQLQSLLGLTIEMDVYEVLNSLHPLLLEPAKRLPRIGPRLQGVIIRRGVGF